MTPVRLVFICGQGGARADFVAGWLGLQSNFINSFWNIDPLTGVSMGEMGSLRLTKDADSLTATLNDLGFELSAEADMCWAVACHNDTFQSDSLITLAEQGKISVADINAVSADVSKIKWEFVVKTYLSKRRSVYSSKEQEFWEVDKLINKECATDSDRIARVKLLLSQSARMSTNATELSKEMNPVILDYSELFCQGGSKYLSKKLNLNIDDIYHNYWDSVVSYANSPTELTVWGHTWKKEDYFK